ILGLPPHGGQNGAQAQVALLKVAHRQHHLVTGGLVAGLLELLGKSRQLVCVGGVVVHHILHQRHELLLGGVLAAAGAGLAALGGAVVVVVGMLMVVLMGMGMLVGMIVVEMHHR